VAAGFGLDKLARYAELLADPENAAFENIADSDSVNLGSNPGPPANNIR
jgi:hypothetical protein